MIVYCVNKIAFFSLALALNLCLFQPGKDEVFCSPSSSTTDDSFGDRASIVVSEEDGVLPCDTFACDNGTHCLSSLDRVCNGQIDCEDGQDESGCDQWACPFQTVKGGSIEWKAICICQKYVKFAQNFVVLKIACFGQELQKIAKFCKSLSQCVGTHT